MLHEQLNDDRLKPPSRSALHEAYEKSLNDTINFEDDNKILRFDGKTYVNIFGKSKVSIIAICINEKLVGFEQVENKKSRNYFQQNQDSFTGPISHT